MPSTIPPQVFPLQSHSHSLPCFLFHILNMELVKQQVGNTTCKDKMLTLKCHIHLSKESKVSNT